MIALCDSVLRTIFKSNSSQFVRACFGVVNSCFTTCRYRVTPIKKCKYVLQYCNTICVAYFVHKAMTMHATTLSFRAGVDFAQQTRALANIVGLKSSDYIRQAVLEKNEQVMAQRIAALSKELSAEHLAINESVEGSLADGLD